MNRLMILLTFMLISLALPVDAGAQKGLNIEKAFSQQFTLLPEATETLLTRSRLHDVSLSLYHALSITGNEQKALEVERMVLADGRTSVSKEVRYVAGHLLYGLYVLPSRGETNRYILFLNGNLSGSAKMILLYIEGSASVADVKKLINKGK